MKYDAKEVLDFLWVFSHDGTHNLMFSLDFLDAQHQPHAAELVKPCFHWVYSITPNQSPLLKAFYLFSTFHISHLIYHTSHLLFHKCYYSFLLLSFRPIPLLYYSPCWLLLSFCFTPTQSPSQPVTSVTIIQQKVMGKPKKKMYVTFASQWNDSC